jgi:hypothetical protein
MNLEQASTLATLKTALPRTIKASTKTAVQVAKFVLDRCERNGYAYKYHTPETWAKRYLDSKEFQLMEIGINAAASPHTPRDPKRVSHYIKCNAGTDIDDPIVVDTNKRKEGRTLLGFIPEIIVQDGKHRKAAKIAQGHSTIVAWVGIKASKKIKKSSIPEVDASKIILPKVENSKIAAAYEIHASTVPVIHTHATKKEKACCKACGARSSGQLEPSDISDRTIPPSASDSGSNTESSDRRQWDHNKPSINAPGTKGWSSELRGPGNPISDSPGSGVGPRLRPNTGASRSEMSRAVHAHGTKVGKIWTKKKKKLQAVAPSGRESQVKELKKKFGEDSSVPFKIAWSQENKGKK